jgi:inositol-phosphate transport system substrate-binding protein
MASDKELHMKHRPPRFLALIVLTIAFALVAAACSSDSTDTTSTGDAGSTGDVELVTLVARCRAKPPIEDGRCNNLLRGVVDANASLEASGDSRRVELKIIQDNPDAGDYVTEFELASSAGDAPDIIAAAHVNIGTWGASGIITDLTDLLVYPEFDDIVPSLWASTELDGRRYGVPQDAEARPLYFRKDLLAELGWTQAEIDGLPDKLASGDFTWEDMFDTAEQAVTAGVVDKGFGWWPRPKQGPMFLAFYYAAGGDILDDSGALVYDKAAAQIVYELMGDAVARDILVDTRLDGDWGSWHDGVALGSVLFWYGGSWQWAEWAELFVADLGGEEYLFENVGFGPFPAIAAGANVPTSLTNPFAYMVSSGSDNPDLALLVISKATTKELNTEHAVTSGHLGILTTQADYEPYTSAVFLSEVAPILEFTTFQPNSPSFSAWTEAYYLGISAVVSGERTPAEAVDLVVAQLEADLGDNVIIK